MDREYTTMIQVRQQWTEGWRYAKANKEQDYTRANRHFEYSHKMRKLSPDRRAENEAFQRGVRMYKDGYWLTDNPYPG